MKLNIFKPRVLQIEKWYSMNLNKGYICSRFPVQTWATPEVRQHWREAEGAEIVAKYNRKAMSGTSILELVKSRSNPVGHYRRTAEVKDRIANHAAILRASQIRRGLNPDEMQPLSTIVREIIRASNEKYRKQREAKYRHSDEYKIRRKLEFQLKEADQGITKTELAIHWELFLLEHQFWNKNERLRKQSVLAKIRARRLGK